MDKKRKLMQILFTIGVLLGYFCLNYLPIELKSAFFVIAILSTIVYLIQSIRNQYGIIHVIMSMLSFLLFVGLSIHYIIIYKYGDYYVYQNYDFIFTLIIFILMFSGASINYFKRVDRKRSIFMKVLIIILIVCIIFIIILIILKKYGFIPE